jgi:hypothetical protein
MEVKPVIDVIGFLCVLLGSSTVKLHDSLGSRRACAYSEAGFGSKNGDRACIVYHRRAAFCCAVFLWAKVLTAKDIHKELFPVYGGKCFSRKAFHNWVETISQGRLKVAGDARPGAEVAEATVERLPCCRFQRTGKALGQVYQCWRRICREINVFFFQVRISHVLRFISICDVY